MHGPFYSNIGIDNSCIKKIHGSFHRAFHNNVYVACSMNKKEGYKVWNNMFPNGYTVVNFSSENGPIPAINNSDPLPNHSNDVLLSFLQRKLWYPSQNSRGYYLGWQDHSANTNHILLFALAIKLSKYPPQTLIIQCGAGLGRSATFIALLLCAQWKKDGVIDLMKEHALKIGHSPNDIIAKLAIQQIRKNRPKAIYKKDQRKLVNKFVLSLIDNVDHCNPEILKTEISKSL